MSQQQQNAYQAQQHQLQAQQFAALQAQQAAQFQTNRQPQPGGTAQPIHQNPVAPAQNFVHMPNNPNGSFPAAMNPAMNAFRIGINGPSLPVPPLQFDDSDEEEEPFLDEDSNALSRINIVIRSPIVITGNSNLIACDAAATANAIALGVVQSLRQLSMGQHGIPMIDEQGRPRPLGVEVIAEMRVEGSQNVVGERAVLARMLDLKEKVAKKKMELARSVPHAPGCVLGEKFLHDHGPGCITAEVNGVVATTPMASKPVATAAADADGGAKVKVEKKRDREEESGSESEQEAAVAPKKSRCNF